MLLISIAEGIRSNPYLPDDVRRVLEIVEENNIGMLNLILHLMFRWGHIARDTWTGHMARDTWTRHIARDT